MEARDDGEIKQIADAPCASLVTAILAGLSESEIANMDDVERFWWDQ